MNCTDVEPIPDTLGGGHLCRCTCGHPRLHGPQWAWWRCPVCALFTPRVIATRHLTEQRRTQLAHYYPEGTP